MTMSDMIHPLDLSQEVEYLMKSFKEELRALLFHAEPLTGQTDTEKWENFLLRISLWKEQFHAQAEEIRLYGYMMWYLDLSITSFSNVEPEDLRASLLKILLTYYFREAKIFFFTAEMNLRQYLDIDCFNLMEHNYPYPISHQDFLDDLAHYYEGSTARYQYWKRDYPDNLNLSAKLDAGYEKYLDYMEHFQSVEHSQVFRINKLGEREGNNRDETEMSMYFIYNESNKKLYLLTMSDFF